MIFNSRNVLLAALMASLLACASPSWKGMSENEIAQWKAGSFDAEQAQVWKRDGFSPAEAQAWMAGGFSANDAGKWHKESFTAAQAKAWKEGSFSLDEAVKARARGLTPVKPE